MDSSGLHNLLSYLQGLQESWDSDADMKDIVQRIKLKIDHLISEWPVDEQGNEGVSVIQMLKRFRTDLVCVSGDQRSTPAAGKLVLPNLEKLRFVKPEIEQMYSFAFKSSRFMNSKCSKDVLSFISLLSEDLKDILSSKSGILVHLRPQIFALQDELRFLSNFLTFISQFCIELRFSEDLLIFAQAVAVNFAYLLHFLRVDKKMDEEMQNGVKTELLDLLEKLNHPQQPELREIYLRALEGTNPKLVHLRRIDYECVLRFLDSMLENLGRRLDKVNLESTAKRPIKQIQRRLSSAKSALIESNEKLDDLILLYILDLTGCFIYSSILKDNIFTDLASDEKLGDLPDKIEGVKNESHHFNMPQSWQSNFPKTNELEYVDFIIKNLKEKLDSKTSPIDSLANQVNTICDDLLGLRDDFDQVAKLWNENEELKALFSRYRDVAYQAEYLVDSFLCGVVPFWSQKMGLVNLVNDLCYIKKELTLILNDNKDQGTGMSVSFMSWQANSLTSNVVLDTEDSGKNTKDIYTDQLVGLKDEMKKIIDKILGGSDQLTIHSITGMPGLGKTTIANSVYRDRLVTMHFHARAWCSVSQVYNKENLLFEILHQVEPKSKEEHEKNKKCFDQQLYQSLKGKKYLVVMDDIWDIDAWDDLRASFPSDNNGSRIIFTTRNQSITLKANGVPHALRLLSDDESWNLLQVRVFKEENCPPELFQVGKKIAENCKGLPLTVVLAAGLLKVTERKKDSWEQFSRVLISHDHLGILDLSYRHLPNYLRPCFLYFGSFPEDATIPVWKLVRLWIAEGFVQPKVGLDSPELEAENYLNALIDRSLVMIAERSYTGRAKACRIHDLLHDFCTDKAREERFLLKIKRGDSLSILTDYEMHEQFRLCIVQPTDRTIPLVRTVHLESRIRSLWFSVVDNLHENPSSMHSTLSSLPSSRSLIPGPRGYDKEFSVIAVLLKFRLLRVLDLGTLEMVGFESFLIITQLLHLRYLSLQLFGALIPDEIENLENLETLLLTGETYLHLPETIWNMVNLKHIQIKPRATVSLTSEFLENCNRLDGLTSLSSLFLCDGNLLEKMMKKLPNLKQLKCLVLVSRDDSENGNTVSADFLNQVEELGISISWQQLEKFSISYLSTHIVFPPSLKKLTLTQFKLSWDEISVIGKLPNLEVLKLDCVELGEDWHMKEGEFKTLKFLTLRELRFREWVASVEHLPRLKQLVMKYCYDLKELPSIGESPSLMMIDLTYCGKSILASARKIQEEQYYVGNDQFKVKLW